MNFSLIKNSVIKYLRVHITSINRWKTPLNSKMQSAGPRTLRSPVEVVLVDWERRTGASGPGASHSPAFFSALSCFENSGKYQRLCDDRSWLTPFWHMSKSYQLKKKDAETDQISWLSREEEQWGAGLPARTPSHQLQAGPPGHAVPVEAMQFCFKKPTSAPKGCRWQAMVNAPETYCDGAVSLKNT